jgi:hypothetical protein
MVKNGLKSVFLSQLVNNIQMEPSFAKIPLNELEFLIFKVVADSKEKSQTLKKCRL